MRTHSTTHRTTRLLVLSLLGTLAGVLATPVQAQSAEYRRGYDAGYQAGVADAQAGRAQSGGAYWPVRIERADYGTAGRFCDARPALEQRLAADRSNVIRADNSLCGDPAEGQVKQLRVTVRCDRGGRQNLVIPEGQFRTFNCR